MIRPKSVLRGMAAVLGLLLLPLSSPAAPIYPMYPSPDEIYLRARYRQARSEVLLFLYYTANETVINDSGRRDLHLHMVIRSADQHALILHDDARIPTPSLPAITPETYVNQAAPTLGPSPFAGFDIGTEPLDTGYHPHDDPSVRSSLYYRIRLLGVESLDGHSVFHLALTPRSMPQRFSTRDLWVDTGNYQTLQAVVQTHALFRTYHIPVYATLRFTEYGRAWLLSSIRAAWNFPETGQERVYYRYGDFHFAVNVENFSQDPADAPP